MSTAAESLKQTEIARFTRLLNELITAPELAVGETLYLGSGWISYSSDVTISARAMAAHYPHLHFHIVCWPHNVTTSVCKIIN